MATNWLNKFISFVLHIKPEVSENPDTYSLRIFQAVCSCKCGKFSWSDRFSNKDWALISMNSSSINSWSWGSSLSLASTPRASASRPWWTSQRGEKGINSIPNPSRTAGTSCKLKGRSHAPLCCPLPVPPIKFYSYQYRCFLDIVWGLNLLCHSRSRNWSEFLVWWTFAVTQRERRGLQVVQSRHYTLVQSWTKSPHPYLWSW